MRVSRLRLRNIRRHRDLVLNLAPGLTIVRGPNEAGKTSIQRALELGLFRRSTTNDQELGAIRSWDAAPRDQPGVELEFESNGSRGQLSKSFGGQRGRVELRLDGERLTDPAAVEARLADLTGVPSEKFYQSTASVRHHELEGLDKDEGALRDRLQQSMSGAGPGTHAARQKLDGAIRRYRAEGPKNPGVLRAARDELGRLAAEARTGESRLQQLARDREALTAARDAHLAAESQLREDSELLATSERAVELLARQTDAQVRYERFRRATELRDEVARLEDNHPSATPLPTLRGAVERLRTLERTISELRADLAAEPDLSGYQVAIPQPRWRPVALIGIVLAVAAVAVGYLGQGAGAGVTASVAALGIAVLAVIAVLVSRRMRRRALDVREQDMLREQAIARRLRGRSGIEQQLRDAERARDEQLARIELADLPAAESLLAAETQHVATIESLQAEFRGVVGMPPPTEDVAALRDGAAAEAEQMRHALAGMGEIGTDPARHRDRYAAAVARDRTARERAIADQAAARAAVEANDVDAETVALVAERLSAAQERLAGHERRLRIYQTTLDVLNAAEQATMKKAARFLEQRMGRDVARITGGRYRRVQVDENELRLRVWSPERGDWVELTELSQGTLDQFYLAARLGLVRQVTRDRKPPLIFDDPFVTFDDERARKALDLLKEMAADHQIVYLTCSARYDTVADRVIELPGPTARDTGPTEPARAG